MNARAPWTRDDVDRFLSRPMAPVRTPWLYRAGLIGVAAALILLQSIYIAMVALAGYATYAYVIRIPTIFEDVHLGWYTFILILTPVVVGVVVTFFLLKPLLAKAPSQAERLRLNPAAEPILFAFVQRLCTSLGSPIPTRIEVDLEVNASARLRRGWRSLYKNDLALTLGLPLVAGLTVRQLAGVLAHEFGHFSQHAGMRLYFLIGAIRHWFARVA